MSFIRYALAVIATLVALGAWAFFKELVEDSHPGMTPTSLIAMMATIAAAALWVWAI